MAERFLRTGKSRWIDVSLNEGWEKSLRDLVRSAIYQRVQNGGEMPSLAQLDQVAVSKDDHKYYRVHGQQLMDFERDQIMDEREGKPALTEKSKRMTGEASGN